MAENDPKVGDKVYLMRDPDRIGTVVEIEPDKYSFDDPTFHTVFVENGPAIPLRRTYLRVVVDN
jgi:hypothetical protein